ncbi:MAG: SEC-C domain-containing protein [Neptuniibacter sp.]
MSEYIDQFHKKLPHARPEQDVFDELEVLSKSPGFIHVIARFSLRDHAISFDEELTYDSVAHQHSQSALLRTEISTLISLMLKGNRWLEEVSHEEVLLLFKQTQSLLHDLHVSIYKATGRESDAAPKDKKWLREAIYYAGESAYGSQYIELSQKRYSQDDQWLLENKGFSTSQAVKITLGIIEVLNTKLNARFNEKLKLEEVDESVLPYFSFTLHQVASTSGENETTVQAFLTAFTISPSACRSFLEATAFNPINAKPIIKLDDQYAVLQISSLAAALFEAPFYWLIKDEAYRKNFISHRGRFTEEFSAERLVRVFGKHRVYQNVEIQETKDRTVGEIDVLVVYGDRAVVLQAKSKQLTLKAKQGDDNALGRDFTHAVQKAYDQAFSCAVCLNSNKYRLVTSSGQAVDLNDLKEIYPICVVSDHYPSLNTQADLYLETYTYDRIQPPYVMDVFFLDIITEFLNSPLHFLNYINLRVHNRHLVVSEQELAVFTMHLTAGLRHSVGDKDPLIVLGGHTSIPVDIAFMARREGFPGDKTPQGILTKETNSPVQKLIKEIDLSYEPAAIQIGFFLLQLSPQDKESFNTCFQEMLNRAKVDGKNHDFSMMPEKQFGITIHFNTWSDDQAHDFLLQHCENRKYKQKTNCWLGLCVSPKTGGIRFGVNLDYAWESSELLDVRTNHMISPNRRLDLKTYVRPTKKVGRNDKCFCGSGKKYKQCCF